MNRRTFLNRLAVGAAAIGTSSLYHPLKAWSQTSVVPTSSPTPRSLAVVSRVLDINGKPASVFGLTQSDGTQGLILDTDTGFNVALTNSISEPTLIHWHGLTPPWKLDGVPGNPAPLLQPGETRPYAFSMARGGTYWMHAHTLQEQNLLAAPLIVHTAEDRSRDEQEVVILLHDFSFTPATELLAKLKGANPSNSSAMGDMSGMSSMSMSGMSGMDMSGMGTADANDIDYDAYLANDRTLADPQIIRVERGGRIRLRIINGATSTAFTIETGKPLGTLVAVDGQPIEPLTGRTFPVAMGQRLDIMLDLPKSGGAFPILALREGASERTGIILASSGSAIVKIPSQGQASGPAIGLELEARLRATSPLAVRPADRHFALKLSGSMAPYAWSMGTADSLTVKKGERVELTFQNMSMMTHPVHLHGHSFQVIAINDHTLAGAVRDTVIVPPMAKVTVAFDADNPGHWPLHCHHLYHMVAGMMTYVAYEGVG